MNVVLERQVCAFSVADHLFALPLSQVQEVLSTPELTPVPLAPPAVRGLINLRGRIVTVFDLRRRLGLPPGGAEAMTVVLRARDGGVSLLVDAVEDVVEASAQALEPPPRTLPPALREFLLGVRQGGPDLGGRLLLVLDAERAVRLNESDDRRQPERSAQGRAGVVSRPPIAEPPRRASST